MIITEAFEGLRQPHVLPFTSESECLNPDLVVGMELEIEQCNRIGREVSVGSIEKLGYQVTTDGSLRGTAYEFISRPMLTKHMLASLEEFFKITKFTEVNYSDRCSVHVHVNCTDMSLEQVSSLALLYQLLEEVLFEFVGQNRDSNIYCIPWNQCRNHHKLVDNFLKSPTELLRGWNKYTALNLIPLSTLGTVEFRQMHGTADMKKLTTWLNIIGGMFKYVKTVELKDLIGTIKELNTSSHYEHFFNQVLCGSLEYNPLYRSKLSEGVILAKFGLVSNKGGKVTSAISMAPARHRTEELPRIDDGTTPITAYQQYADTINTALNQLNQRDRNRGVPLRYQPQPPITHYDTSAIEEGLWANNSLVGRFQQVSDVDRFEGAMVISTNANDEVQV